MIDRITLWRPIHEPPPKIGAYRTRSREVIGVWNDGTLEVCYTFGIALFDGITWKPEDFMEYAEGEE